MNKKIIIANWKMQKSYLEAIDWCNNYKLEIEKLAQETKKNLILCPSYETLGKIKEIFENSNIYIGAQNCSNFLLGAYTGQVSAQSLKEIGINFCIIGHSEDRKYNCTNDNLIGQKVKMLLKHNITPIICIGESLEEKNENKTQDVIKKQLDTILKEVDSQSYSKLIIAYEPIWAIGTGVTPTGKEIFNAAEFIKNLYDIKIIYGGSVNDQNVIEFKNINNIDGFLLGTSSLDFQVFKKIVLLY